MTTDPGKGRLAIEVTPSKHRRLGAYRLVHVVSDDEWALIAYSDAPQYLEAIQNFLEDLRAMKPEVREAEARVLLRVLGVGVEELR